MTRKPKSKPTNCPDCHVPPGLLHRRGCDVARCAKTGFQRLGCGHTSNACNTVWAGHWPGDAECIEYGLVLDLGPDAEPMPDLNRLYALCDWDPKQQRMLYRAPLFDAFTTKGTDGVHQILRLADDTRITLTTRPGSPGGIDEVFLWPGLDVPDGDGWNNEDSWELQLTAGDTGQEKGRLFYEVPVNDVRALIARHGGEHPDQTS
ncbi:hypothetical protein [Streptomyces sp. NPDC017958]|uniref:hypothetical protein n=1 Tax=Streptomyces sp. NPDC017958 TaxID=3365021 RepID=UPI0037A2756C